MPSKDLLMLSGRGSQVGIEGDPVNVDEIKKVDDAKEVEKKAKISKMRLTLSFNNYSDNSVDLKASVTQ